ncbi:uncharacterized protein LOC115424088 [Sphaeramia orbicularis]|uniref:uncharacterized protein LOC115424088 n=1 Tax=Sphaeramia orbicularis TaxID=375764 RepID=UPI00117FA0E1|nr:uncharacterized protein LOC115424088 [Sphaeramia orbicularis]
MKAFLKPFVDECCDLAQNPFHWMDSNGSVHSSKVFAVICSSDAEARPLLRNCKKFNGEHGCDWCLHPGTTVEKGSGSMRSYTYDKEKRRARSDEMFRHNAETADHTGEPNNGVKGHSLLSNIPKFDMVFGFIPEYMHSVLLGVTRQLMSLWLDPSNSAKPWFVGEQISEMDRRLLGLKPPVEISESPRSLKCRDSWKASEWRAFLLFYVIHVLPRFLSCKFLEHFFLLSFSIHILLQESISQDDLQLAHDYLVHFVVNMKVLYGEENVSFNCHQLIHLSKSVLNWGPLWATSAFSFERNNGALWSLLKTNNYNAKHVTEKFHTWQHIPRHISSLVYNHCSDFSSLLTKMSPGNDGSGSFKPLGEAHLLDLKESIKLMLERLFNRRVFAKSVETYDKFTYSHTVYHSTNFEKSDKTDCVIELKNGSYGEMHMLLFLKENCMCTSSCVCQVIPVIVVNMYVTKPVELFGQTVPCRPSKTVFVTAESTGQLKAFFLENIRCKRMYVNGLLVPVPNTHERY